MMGAQQPAMLSKAFSPEQQQALLQQRQQQQMMQSQPMMVQPRLAQPPQGVVPPHQAMRPMPAQMAPPAQLAQPAQPAAPPATQLMAVTCPMNCKGGDPLTVQVNGRKFALVVPAGVTPGQTFRVQLAAPKPAPLQHPAAPQPGTQAALQAAALQRAIAGAQAGQQPYVGGPMGFKPPKQPAALKPPKVPQFSLLAPEKLSLVLVAPHSVIDPESKSLTIDKRCFSLVCKAVDANGAVTAAPLALMASLAYEDGEPIMPPEARTTAMVGKQALACKHGQCTFKLRMDLVSSMHGGKRFRVRVTPQDAALAVQRPGLVVETEPLAVVYNNKKLGQGVKPGGSGVAGANGAGTSGTKGGNNKGGLGGPAKTIGKGAAGAQGDTQAHASKVTQAAALLKRRRYFPAEAIRAVTDAPLEDGLQRADGASGADPTGDGDVGDGAVGAAGDGAVPLSRHGVAACDRLAAMVVQQLTQRAWRHARRSRSGTRELVGDDVAKAASKGLFDFLGTSGVVNEWISAEQLPALASRAAPPPARVDAPPALPPVPPAPALLPPVPPARAPSIPTPALAPGTEAQAPMPMDLESPAPVPTA